MSFFFYLGCNFETAKVLIAAGANVNAKDKNNATPLHVAANREKFKTAKLLIDSGADVNAQTDMGTTPLHNAAGNGDMAIAKLLLDAGANPNMARESRFALADGTPLHTAAYHNHVEMIRLLADYGADLDRRNTQGFTPLGLAVEKQEFKIRYSYEEDPQGLKPAITQLVALGASVEGVEQMRGYNEDIKEAIERGKRLRAIAMAKEKNGDLTF